MDTHRSKEIRYRDGRKLCTATSKRTKEPCEALAMTDKNVCYMHGGKAGRPITHGLYSKRLQNQPELAERIQELKDDPELLNMTTHLAAIITCLEKFLENIPADYKDYDKTVETLSLVVERIAKIKEKEHKIKVGYYLTPDQQRVWVSMLGAVLRKHVTDRPTLEAMAKDIKAIPMPE